MPSAVVKMREVLKGDIHQRRLAQESGRECRCVDLRGELSRCWRRNAIPHFSSSGRLLVEWARSRAGQNARGLVQERITPWLHGGPPSRLCPFSAQKCSPTSASQLPSGLHRMRVCSSVAMHTPHGSHDQSYTPHKSSFSAGRSWIPNAPVASSLKVNRREIYKWQIYSKQG